MEGLGVSASGEDVYSRWEGVHASQNLKDKKEEEGYFGYKQL